MRGAGVDENRVGGTRIVSAPIGAHDRHLWQFIQVSTGASRQIGVELDGNHTSGGSNQVRQNCTVISRATSDVHHLLALAKFECVEPLGKDTWQPVVQLTAGSIDTRTF